MCVSAGLCHDVCEIVGGGVTVCADFVDAVINPVAVVASAG